MEKRTLTRSNIVDPTNRNWKNRGVCRQHNNQDGRESTNNQTNQTGEKLGHRAHVEQKHNKNSPGVWQ